MKRAREIHGQICSSRSGQLLSATEAAFVLRATRPQRARAQKLLHDSLWVGVCQCQFYWSYPFASAARVDALEKQARGAR